MDYRPVDPNALQEFIYSQNIDFYKNFKHSWVFDCPRCKKSKKLYIRKTDGRFICWYCVSKDSYQGRPEFALSDLTGLPVDYIQREIYGSDTPKASDELDISMESYYPEAPEGESEGFVVLTTVEWPLDYYPIEAPQSEQGRKYLKEERGVGIELAIKYRLRYSPEERCIIFPIYQHGTSLVGWQRRPIYKTEWIDKKTGETRKVPKYVSSLTDRNYVLMFEENLEDTPHCVLTEGPLDGIKADLCGGNVVTMGTAIAPGQIERILDTGITKIYLALDRDADQQSKEMVKRFLLEGIEVFGMVPPKGKDLGKMTPIEVLDLFNHAETWTTSSLIVSLD